METTRKPFVDDWPTATGGSSNPVLRPIQTGVTLQGLMSHGDDSSCLYDCSNSGESSSMFALSTVKRPRASVSSSEDATLPGGAKVKELTWRGPAKRCGPRWMTRELLFQVIMSF